MFAPENEKACPSCTSIIDGIDGMVFHAEQRVNIAVIAKNSIEKWRNGQKEEDGRMRICFHH